MTFIKGHTIRNTGRTWWKKGRTPWNKGLKIAFKPKTGWSITCVVCGNEKYYQLNEHKKRVRRYCSPDCYHIDSQKVGAKYQALHSWVRRHYGKADKCIYCGNDSIVDWANISKEYKRDINDWIKLCRKHHIAYDRGKNTLNDFISLTR